MDEHRRQTRGDVAAEGVKQQAGLACAHQDAVGRDHLERHSRPADEQEKRQAREGEAQCAEGDGRKLLQPLVRDDEVRSPDADHQDAQRQVKWRESAAQRGRLPSVVSGCRVSQIPVSLSLPRRPNQITDVSHTYRCASTHDEARVI